jgi:hypothetical protein
MEPSKEGGKETGSVSSGAIRSGTYEFLRAIGPLRNLVRNARGLLHRYRVPAWYLEGIGRADGTRVSMVFAGQLRSKNYFAHLMFGREHSERSLGAVWLWTVWRKGVRLGTDLIVTHEWTGSRISWGRSSGFCVPCWIGTEVDLKQAANLCRTSENVKSDVRRMNRNGLTYAVTTDPGAIASFYSTMYVPYVERAHGSRTMLTLWDEFALELGRAELMLLQKDGETIAGNLLVDLGGRRARTRAVGVKDGDYAYVKMGAVAALYYLEISHLREKGYERLHYGASRPFVKDGVLCFKRKYGARVVDRDRRMFRIQVARYSDGAKAFLRNNPFISESGGRFYANFFVDRSSDINSRWLRAEMARYNMAGTEAARVYSMEDVRGPLDTGGGTEEPVLVELRDGASQLTPAS